MRQPPTENPLLYTEGFEEVLARELNKEAYVEWVCGDRYGTEWDVVKGNLYEWERQAELRKNCRERSAKQQLRENASDE